LHDPVNLFHYLADYESWTGVQCGVGVKPNHYLTHLTKWHTDHSEVNTSKKARMLLVEELMLQGVTDPDLPGFQLPQPGLLALPHFPIHEGLSCLTCDYTCLAKQMMESHYQRQHAAASGDA
jgi:hypothetical protein